MASLQSNILFLVCATFCLYWTISPAEAQSSHCGYHYAGHYVATLYNSTHYSHYYRVYLGVCSSGILSYELPVTYNGEPLYWVRTYYRIGKRYVSTLEGQLEAGPEGLAEREIENDKSKREESAVKNVQKADYADILKDLRAKRSIRALQEAGPEGLAEREIENDKSKREESAVKNVQKADYADILKDLRAKRSIRALQKAESK
ncbi:uncharacterized protein LOC111104151 isoform X2 [Crassostrea virginica]